MADRDCHVETELRTDRKRPFDELRNGVCHWAAKKNFCVSGWLRIRKHQSSFSGSVRGDATVWQDTPAHCLARILPWDDRLWIREKPAISGQPEKSRRGWISQDAFWDVQMRGDKGPAQAAWQPLVTEGAAPFRQKGVPYGLPQVGVHAVYLPKGNHRRLQPGMGNGSSWTAAPTSGPGTACGFPGKMAKSRPGRSPTRRNGPGIRKSYWRG